LGNIPYNNITERELQEGVSELASVTVMLQNTKMMIGEVLVNLQVPTVLSRRWLSAGICAV
jgi:hypothetical protein